MILTRQSRSWIDHANGHADFPLHNLPLGIFSRGDAAHRCGVAIGEAVLDLHGVLAAGLLDGLARQAVEATADGALNGLFGLGPAARVALRERLLDLLGEHSEHQAALEPLLYPSSECQMHVPARVGDYTDFYVGIQHATNVGKLFRPDSPLLPNYKYVPIGYHGRASTLRPSGADVRRPKGQTLPAGHSEPRFGPCARLDYELELGIWIGQGNAIGEPIDIAEAGQHVAGLCLLNDWSARDIQAWEYQPLGPFLSKSFITTLSPWVITAEALQPFRCAQPARPAGDPQPLAYMLDAADQAHGAFDIELQVLLLTPTMREQGLAPQRLTLSNSLSMYWTVAQLVAHHSVNGCQLQPGDLFGSGTLSGADPQAYGSLLEITEGGKRPLLLSNGEQRTFLEDGDEIILRGRCVREGVASIGFGECRGRVVAAP
ncbi:fumarylacetoacetase [Pseudomonas cremoricolorata]|uniref:fumarylacetoacetase n=1 Tax=Pseudomonas cremoricolorata TaxID=157783 RepID=A0A089WQV3_9PSED|nr:fumarylacetoacetase [Pseudomonas cremoricolorata]AIR89549.1 fumarylacetoacetase [Pseudomonas cremoricolorata]